MMKLFKLEAYELKVEPEALLIKPFKKIWTRDRSETKQKALMELGFIYFFADPRSSYQYIVDEEQRIKEIIDSEGLPKSWKPDSTIKEGIDIYRKHSQTTASLLLEDSRIAIEKVRKELRELDMKEVGEDGKRLHTLKSVQDSVKSSIGLIAELNRVEMEMTKELVENSKIRGQGELTVLEDDLGK